MLLSEDDLEAVAHAYHGQIVFGSNIYIALELVTIVYQHHHPYAIANNTRIMVEGVLAHHRVPKPTSLFQ